MRTVMGILVSVLLLASGAVAELVANPAYENWSKFKPGTSISYRQNTNMGAGMSMQMDITQSLKEVTEEKAVVEVAISNSMLPGGSQTHTQEVPAKVEKENAVSFTQLPPGMEGEAKSLGKEKVKVGETEYECEVTQIKGVMQGISAEGKSWTSDQVPGGLVKMEMKATGEQGAVDTNMQLTKIDIK